MYCVIFGLFGFRISARVVIFQLQAFIKKHIIAVGVILIIYVIQYTHLKDYLNFLVSAELFTLKCSGMSRVCSYMTEDSFMAK